MQHPLAKMGTLSNRIASTDCLIITEYQPHLPYQCSMRAALCQLRSSVYIERQSLVSSLPSSLNVCVMRHSRPSLAQVGGVPFDSRRCCQRRPIVA